MNHHTTILRFVALAAAAGHCVAFAQQPQPRSRWTQPVEAPSGPGRAAPRTPPPQRETPPPTVVNQAFLDAYQAFQRPRIAVIGTGWRDEVAGSSLVPPVAPGSDANSPATAAAPTHRQDPTNMANSLANTIGQLLTGPGVQRVACSGGPTLAKDAAMDRASAAIGAGRRCDADIIVMLTVADLGDAYAGSYVMVDGRRGATLGSWEFSIVPDTYGVLDRNQLNSYCRQLAEHIRDRFSQAAAGSKSFTIRFSGIEPADLATLQRVLRQVPGVQRVSEARQDAAELGINAGVDIEYVGSVPDLPEFIISGAGNERIRLRVDHVRLGDIALVSDSVGLRDDAFMLCGDDEPPAQAAAAIEALRRAYGSAGSPPIGFAIENDADGELAAALSRRLRAIGLTVLDRGEAQPGDLELCALPAAGGGHSFRLVFRGGDELAACPAERAKGASPDRRARAAVGLLVAELRRSLEAPASVRIALLGAHAIEDVTPVIAALRGLPGVTSVHVRSLSTGKGVDAADIWLGYRGSLEDLLTQLKSRRDAMPFSLDDSQLRHDALELTIKDK
ncbi:MAG: hypothetical protein JSR77_13245 [Planctomycetes bacterium]|nr:hypothetical protein [Planctomycetota bacterium]